MAIFQNTNNLLILGGNSSSSAVGNFNEDSNDRINGGDGDDRINLCFAYECVASSPT